MKCLLCGSENNDGMKFCTQCGAMLTQPEEVKQEKEETVETVEVAESAESVVEVPTEAVAAAVETPVMETPVADVVVPEATVVEEVMTPETPVVEEVTAPEVPVVEAVAAPVPPMPPVTPMSQVPPMMPPMPKPVTITDKELMPVRENAWTGILKGVALFFYILELVAVVIITVLRVMGTDVIPIPRMPMVALIIFAVGAVLVLTLVFVITMCLLNVASDITKSRKHMRNIEYILRKK